MQLSILLQDVKTQEVPAQEIEICGITDCAQQVRPGDAFVCIPGARQDGHDFAEEAICRGASVLIVQRRLPVPLQQVVAESARQAYARMWGNWYGNPARRMHLTAITGTNGKTTTSWMLHHILTGCGYRTGRMGTIPDPGVDPLTQVHYTTPEPPILHRTLHGWSAQGMTHGVLEASSQALVQHRLDGLEFSCGVFTNLSPEHLDVHGSMESYYRCKRMLFDHCSRAVICTDDLWGRRLAAEVPCTVRTASVCTAAADYTVSDIVPDARGTSFVLQRCGQRYPVQIPMTGIYNISNALCAAAAAEQYGVPLTEVVQCLATLPVIPGRMERLPLDVPFDVFIDYAHTPEALQQVLMALRPVCRNRLAVVFGCGGDRDRQKRPEMGRIAAAWADMVWITDDNPRSEDPDQIRMDVAAGLSPERRRIVPGRAEAIAAAIAEAQAGDVVLIAGKGHEQYQIFSSGVYPLNEYHIAAQAAAMWAKRKGRMNHGTDQTEKHCGSRGGSE
jgi:UDP-N-acetylmuramoyl-L-alanyl-D-glutamate--2,6-diaminopimelate ligase